MIQRIRRRMAATRAARHARPPATLPQATDGTGILRVMTYNIHHGRGMDRRYDLDRVAEVIRAASPDVVALQEVERFRRRTGGDDQPALLGKALGMHHAFAAVRDHRHDDGHDDAGYGIAVLSKHPIAARHHFNITYGSAREPRGCLHAALDIGGGSPLHVFCVHLGLRYRERHFQMERILSEEIVNSHRYGDGPRILLGDFNNWWPVQSARAVHTHFHDACAITGRKRLRTFGRFFDYLCLDYIFTSRNCEILTCDVLARGHARVASDHRPLVCTLRLPVSG
jgi:endonuclease/exonuclease/phosphatase family metal-dependent hydrolase